MGSVLPARVTLISIRGPGKSNAGASAAALVGVNERVKSNKPEIKRQCRTHALSSLNNCRQSLTPSRHSCENKAIDTCPQFLSDAYFNFSTLQVREKCRKCRFGNRGIMLSGQSIVIKPSSFIGFFRTVGAQATDPRATL